MWIDVRDKLPEIVNGSESEEVLGIARKFGFSNDDPEYDEYAIIWWNGETWEDNEQDDFENNPDYYQVIYWMEIPELKN